MTLKNELASYSSPQVIFPTRLISDKVGNVHRVPGSFRYGFWLGHRSMYGKAVYERHL